MAPERVLGPNTELAQWLMMAGCCDLSWRARVLQRRPVSGHLLPVTAVCTSSSSSSLFILLPLSPQGEQFCSATHCAIFGPLCYLPFKDAVAVCWCIKRNRVQRPSKCIRERVRVCARVCADQRVCVYAELHGRWERGGWGGGEGVQIWVEWTGC